MVTKKATKVAKAPTKPAPVTVKAHKLEAADTLAVRQRVDLPDQPWEVIWGKHVQQFATEAEARAFVPG